MQTRKNGGHKRKALTEPQRLLVMTAMEETTKHLEATYQLSTVMPFVIQQKAAYEAKERFWNKLWEVLGMDSKKTRLRVIILGILMLILSGLIGPTKALTFVISHLPFGD